MRVAVARTGAGVAGVIALAFAIGAGSGAAVSGPHAGVTPKLDHLAAVGGYIVTLKSGDPQSVAAEHSRLGVRVEQVYDSALHGYSARMSSALARRVAADDRVRSVVADSPISAASQGVPAGVSRVNAAVSTTRVGDGGGEVDADIAILDTGIDAGHPDLNVAGGVDCVSGAGGRRADPPQSGAAPGLAPGVPTQDEPVPPPAPEPDDPDAPGSAGPDAPAPAPLGSYDDNRGHGTHIAGIAAARDNGIGVAGVAPGARLWAVRVLDDAGNGTLATLICGIEWVTENAAVIEVANMSLAGVEPARGCADGGLHEAVCRAVEAGIVFTVAAGNGAQDAATYSPAAFEEVITVSALADFDGRLGALAPTPLGCLGSDDAFAPFSNFGAPVDLIAPGSCVRSTWRGGTYATLSGTSQAAAHVAGAIALYRGANPTATVEQVRAALLGAGSPAWEIATDPDASADPLLDVSSF
ncbi:MAG: S8 family serine peptidase [Sporichthyaceae bacterium]